MNGAEILGGRCRRRTSRSGRQAFGFLDRLDPWAGAEALLEYADPEIVLESAIVSGAEGNAYRGHEGFGAWAADSEAAFDELRTASDEFRDSTPSPHAWPCSSGAARSGIPLSSPRSPSCPRFWAGSSRLSGLSERIRASKPPGCRSRRRRRRTSKRCAGSTRQWLAATSGGPRGP